MQAVTLCDAGAPYLFLVSNMSVSAKASMYHAGMQPVVLSDRAQHERGEGWRRSGTQVTVTVPHHTRPHSAGPYYPL